MSNDGAGGRFVPGLPSVLAVAAPGGGGLRELPPCFTSVEVSSVAGSFSSPSPFLLNSREKILIGSPSLPAFPRTEIGRRRSPAYPIANARGRRSAARSRRTRLIPGEPEPRGEFFFCSISRPHQTTIRRLAQSSTHRIRARRGRSFGVGLDARVGISARVAGERGDVRLPLHAEREKNARPIARPRPRAPASDRRGAISSRGGSRARG